MSEVRPALSHAPLIVIGRRGRVASNQLSGDVAAGARVWESVHHFATRAAKCQSRSDSSLGFIMRNKVQPANRTPAVISAISVDTGTGTFTGADSFNVQWDNAVHLAAADANGDGFPDPGATPLLTITNLTGSAKRVPLP